MMLHDLFTNRQSQTRAFGFARLIVFDLLESLEDLVKLVGGNTRTCVLNEEVES